MLSDLNPKNWFWGHIFRGSIGPIVSNNNRVHPRMDPHQPCNFRENWFKITICIVTFYKYISILTFRDIQNENVTTTTSPTHPLLKSIVSRQSLFRSEISLKKQSEVIFLNISRDFVKMSKFWNNNAKIEAELTVL